MSKHDEVWQQWLGDGLLPMWIEAMGNNFTIFQNLEKNLNEAREDGVDSYIEEINGSPLEYLLGVEQTPTPNNKACKSIMKDFKKAVEYQIKFRKADLELLVNPSRGKTGKAGFWLSGSRELFDKAYKKFRNEFGGQV